MTHRNDGKPWSAQDDADMRRLYPHNDINTLVKLFGRSIGAITNKAYRLGLQKAADYQQPRYGTFQKGMTPWNKGKPHNSPGTEKSRFKKGHRPHNHQPIGHERINRDGYLERKVRDAEHSKDNFESVHNIIWREHHGPIPDSHAVVFRDGNKRNLTIDNLELVSRAELMKRNSYHTNYPPEIARLIQLRGALNRKINRKTQESTQ